MHSPPSTLVTDTSALLFTQELPSLTDIMTAFILLKTRPNESFIQSSMALKEKGESQIYIKSTLCEIKPISLVFSPDCGDNIPRRIYLG